MRVSEESKIKTYYQALVERKQEYLGIFYVGVKTTSIFCIPTCRARKPKPENVEFFTDFKDALDHGYRPCKICKPTQNAYEAPEDVQLALQLMKENPFEKIRDQDLREAGINPESVRRWFKSHYGLTFQAYQRMFRINGAYQELQKGKSATETAFDNGYESLSGFGYTYKKLLGSSPQKSMYQETILMDRLTTPLGPMFICATSRGICLLEFVDRKMLETEFRDLQRLFKAKIIAGENEYIQQVKKEIHQYFAGERTTFGVALDTPGTDFQKNVWDVLKTIPYGTTRSYQQQAELLGKPEAVRAVASANGFNRVAIIIPCHRVIGKNGKLTGYGGGLERKRWLLEHEERSENSKSK